MHCTLCREDRPAKNSHIVPEFLYRTQYDSMRATFHQVETVPEGRKTELQKKGLREPLLCDDCERRFSAFEQYAGSVLNGRKGISCQRQGAKLFLAPLDYQQFKLCQMSILWRAGVSTQPAYRHVSLGPHEPVLRRMLLANDPGPADAYGCVMFALDHRWSTVDELVVEPTWARFYGQYSIRFAYGAFVWIHLVAHRQVDEFIIENCAQPMGKCSIQLRNLEQISYLVKTVARLHNIGKLTDPIW